MSSRYTTEFRELKKLGRGGFGTVFEAENQLDKKLYAVKKIPIKDGHPGHRDKILREVLALSIMDHPHVVRYFQAWIEDGWTVEQSSSEEESSQEDSVEANATLYIQMKFCPETLHELLESCRKSKTFLDNETVWRYFRQIVEGVHHIHEKSFVHRDLSRANIFLDETKNIKIGDFGLATFLQDRSCAVAITGDAGNLLYIAPELQEEDAQVNEKADIFSLGLLLCDLIYQFTTDRERIEVFTKLRQGFFPEEPEILSELLASTPSARPSTSEILQKDLPWREIGLDYARYLENKVQTLQTTVCGLTSEIEELKKMVHQHDEGE